MISRSINDIVLYPTYTCMYKMRVSYAQNCIHRRKIWLAYRHTCILFQLPCYIHHCNQCHVSIKVLRLFRVFLSQTKYSLTCLNIKLAYTVYPKKYAHGFCFAVLCCGYTLTDFPISTRLTSLALWQSNDCPSASKATLMNMDKYFMWIHYERLHNHNKAKHNKAVCIFLEVYCMLYTSCMATKYILCIGRRQTYRARLNIRKDVFQ